jgi:hypothetical protein
MPKIIRSIIRKYLIRRLVGSRANVAAQNIKLTIGVGDIVNTATDPIQWANAVHSIGILHRTPVEHRRAS